MDEKPTILTSRYGWMLFYENAKNNHTARPVVLTCKKFGISRKTFYKWLKRYKNSENNTTSLIDRSRRPHNFPKATPDSIVQILLKEKVETGFGQRRLREILSKKYNISLSERTIWKILRKHSETIKTLSAYKFEENENKIPQCMEK